MILQYEKEEDIKNSEADRFSTVLLDICAVVIITNKYTSPPPLNVAFSIHALLYSTLK